jgi:hypothetical protein
MSDARYAYHEAGHAVAAAVMGFPFRSSGMHIDRDGKGTTLVVCPSRKCSNPFSDLQESQARMIIVLFAGLAAQKKFCTDPSNSASDDDKKIEQYLGAIYRTEPAKLIARDYLRQEAERLVGEFWFAISALAENLWGKECTPVLEKWDTVLMSEKTLGASAIAEILKDWDITVSVDDVTVEDEATPVAD